MARVSIPLAAEGFAKALGFTDADEAELAERMAETVASRTKRSLRRVRVKGGLYCADLGSDTRRCSEGGDCEFEPDLEYDDTGDTINCVKCGEPPPL